MEVLNYLWPNIHNRRIMLNAMSHCYFLSSRLTLAPALISLRPEVTKGLICKVSGNVVSFLHLGLVATVRDIVIFLSPGRE